MYHEVHSLRSIVLVIHELQTGQISSDFMAVAVAVAVAAAAAAARRNHAGPGSVTIVTAIGRQSVGRSVGRAIVQVSTRTAEDLRADSARGGQPTA